MILHVEISQEAEDKLDAIGRAITARSGDKALRPEVIECMIRQAEVELIALAFLKTEVKRLQAAGVAK